MATFLIQGRPATQDQLTAILRSDPVLTQLFQQARSMGGGENEKEALIQNRLRELGVQLPNDDWSVDYDKGGWRVEQKNFFNRNKNWIIPAAIGAVAAPVAIGALAGGGAAAGTGGAAAGTAGTAAAGTAAAAAAPSLLHSLLPTIISAGAGVGGSYLAARGQSQAAKTEAESADKALQVQQQMYQQQRADFGPYRSAGQGAVQALARGLGVENYPDTTIPGASNIPGLPNQYGNLRDLSGQPQAATQVTMRAPNGETRSVPADQQTYWEGRGAVRVP